MQLFQISCKQDNIFLVKKRTILIDGVITRALLAEVGMWIRVRRWVLAEKEMSLLSIRRGKRLWGKCESLKLSIEQLFNDLSIRKKELLIIPKWVIKIVLLVALYLIVCKLFVFYRLLGSEFVLDEFSFVCLWVVLTLGIFGGLRGIKLSIWRRILGIYFVHTTALYRIFYRGFIVQLLALFLSAYLAIRLVLFLVYVA